MLTPAEYSNLVTEDGFVAATKQAIADILTELQPPLPPEE